MKFREIPQFPKAYYNVSVEWEYLARHIKRASEMSDSPFVMEPDYQRGHVWSTKQRSAYVEYSLMGGESSQVITTNCPGWMGNFEGPYELVDGLQRLTSVLMFLDNKVKAFGCRYRDFEDRLKMSGPSFQWKVMTLPSRKDVLKLYLLMNDGGVVHSSKEIARVRKLLGDENE